MRPLLIMLSCVILIAAIVIATLHLGFGYSLETISLKVGLVAGIVTGVAVIYTKAIKPALQHVHVVSKLLDDVREVVDSHSGVDFDKLVEDVRWIISDLRPNSGSSLRDAVDRIEEKLIIMEKRDSAIHQDSPIALFRCTPQGKNMDVNRTFCRFLKCSKEELLDYGWRNFLGNSEDANQYQYFWDESSSQGREVSLQVDFRATDGASVGLEVHAYPITGKEGTVVEYLGMLYPRIDSDDPELD